jgi:hypothetical protein
VGLWFSLSPFRDESLMRSAVVEIANTAACQVVRLRGATDLFLHERLLNCCLRIVFH